MSKKKKDKQDLLLELVRQSRDRNWEINPVTKVIKNKKNDKNRRACRGKVVD